MKFINYIIFVFIIIHSGCSDLLVNEPDTNKNKEDYDSAYLIAKEKYPFFKFKNINWDSLYFKYKPDAENAKGDEIYLVLNNLFKDLKDGHIVIKTKGGYPAVSYLPERVELDRKTFSQLVVGKYFHRPMKLAGEGKILYEILDNKIGYIYFSTFSIGDYNWIMDINNLLEYMADTKGLIFDVRNNEGGNTIISDYIISHFIRDQIQYSFTDSKGKVATLMIKPFSSIKYLKPIVILINGASFSCAELLPEEMRQLSNVTLVGKTTGGGGGSYDDFILPSGKRLQIPISYFTKLDGSMVEWNGVLPDIFVDQTEADIQNQKDKQLEYAVNYLQQQ